MIKQSILLNLREHIGQFGIFHLYLTGMRLCKVLYFTIKSKIDPD